MSGLQSGLPDEVAGLLSAIDSVAELEVLLFLHRRPDAEWDPSAVADLLYLDRALAASIFKRLQACGFLTSREQPLLLYRYAPPLEVQSTVERLSAVYAERRLMVIALLAGRRRRGLELFASAFRLRGLGGAGGGRD